MIPVPDPETRWKGDAVCSARRNAERSLFRRVRAFRDIHPPQRLGLIPMPTEGAESSGLLLRGVPDVAVGSRSRSTRIGGHSENGRGAATVRVGEQINQCLDFTPSALLRRLHDTRLEPTNIAPD